MNATDETAFARGFLAAAEGKQTRYGNDYVPSPNEMSKAGFKLPEMLPAKQKSVPTEKASTSLKIKIKSLRPPAVNEEMDVSLDDVVSAIKSYLSSALSTSTTAIRLVYKGKVLLESSSMRELFGTEQKEALIHAMITKETTSTPLPSNTDKTRVKVGRSKDFWVQLQAWLWEKMPPDEASSTFEVFKKAYEGQQTA